MTPQATTRWPEPVRGATTAPARALRVRRQPANPGVTGWRAILLPEQLRSYPALAEPISADVVIIGGGFAGLFAAHRLHALQPNWRIVVLEAQRIAEGPSGRNSGFMIDLPHVLTASSYHKDDGADRQQIELNRQAITYAAALVESLDIDRTAFQRSGKINAAAGESGERANAAYAQTLKALGEPHEWLDARAMHEVTGSRYYRSGLATPGTVLLQPAQFVQALARGLSRQVDIREASPVRALHRQGSAWHVECAGGSVSAPAVILAVNGHVQSFGLYRNRLMHVFTFASMTRPLDAAEQRNLGGAATWAMTPADPMGTTLRRIDSAQGPRLLVRNRFHFAPSMTVDEHVLAAARADHRRSLDARFPTLTGVPMEHFWGGALCLSRNDVNAFGRIDEGLISACCCNGLGTVQSTLSGVLAADLLCGVDSKALQSRLAQPAPSFVLPGPWTTWAANRVIAHRERRAGADK